MMYRYLPALALVAACAEARPTTPETAEPTAPASTAAADRAEPLVVAVPDGLAALELADATLPFEGGGPGAAGPAGGGEVAAAAGAPPRGPEIPAIELPEPIEIRVRHGESLYDLARWAGLTVEDLETLNHIDSRVPLLPGQRISLALTAEERERFEERRDGFARRRVERYLAARGGLVELKTHRVRTGETAWDIARDYGDLPLWLLAAFNEGKDLDRLAIADELQVPVVADVLAAAPVEAKSATR